MFREYVDGMEYAQTPSSFRLLYCFFGSGFSRIYPEPLWQARWCCSSACGNALWWLSCVYGLLRTIIVYACFHKLTESPIDTFIMFATQQNSKGKKKKITTTYYYDTTTVSVVVLLSVVVLGHPCAHKKISELSQQAVL